PQAVIYERPSSVRIADDPAVDPSRPAVALPPEMLEDHNPGGSCDGMDRMRMTGTPLTVAGTAETTVPLTEPCVVRVKAALRADSELTVDVFKDGSPIGRATATRLFDGQRVANAWVNVPSAGDMVVRTSAGSLSQPVDVELLIAVLDQSAREQLQ